jgi:E3 ubiquitin-protein ligase HERC2
VGEGATDAGGPYNEVMSIICDELQSKYLSLFVQSQNAVHNIGENRDTWVINPRAENHLSKELFLFLGKMIGVAIRT